MEEKVSFKYFYGDEADAYTFYRIPKQLFTSDYFKELSTDAKVLYGLMLDRMALSIKNEWFDSENRAYIYFSIEDVMELLNCGHNKAVKSMQELDTNGGIGLIEKKRRGMGKTNVIYVKNFTLVGEDVATQKFIKGNSEEEKQPKKFTKRNSEIPQEGIQEVWKSNSNNTEINNNNISENKSNLIISADRKRSDEMMAYAEIIRDNLAIDLLAERYPFERELLEGIYDLVLETVLTQGDTVVISSNEYPTQLVKSKFLKLNSSHIEYVIDCMQANTTKVRNIKKYLLSALFNAPTTISSYYQAAVNYDFPQYAKAK